MVQLRHSITCCCLLWMETRLPASQVWQMLALAFRQSLFARSEVQFSNLIVQDSVGLVLKYALIYALHCKRDTAYDGSLFL